MLEKAKLSTEHGMAGQGNRLSPPHGGGGVIPDTRPRANRKRGPHAGCPGKVRYVTEWSTMAWTRVKRKAKKV